MKLQLVGMGKTQTGWWQLKYFLFLPLFGEDSQFDENVFSIGLVQPPTSQDIDNYIILFASL